jgi:hypothetical protein
MRSPDQSGIADVQRVEKSLPIIKPYWLTSDGEAQNKVRYLNFEFHGLQRNKMERPSIIKYIKALLFTDPI